MINTKKKSTITKNKELIASDIKCWLKSNGWIKSPRTDDIYEKEFLSKTIFANECMRKFRFRFLQNILRFEIKNISYSGSKAASWTRIDSEYYKNCIITPDSFQLHSQKLTTDNKIFRIKQTKNQQIDSDIKEA